MASQWQNFLRNEGEWLGTFASLSSAGELLQETPSLLSLEQGEEGRLVRFRLRRYGPEGREAPPTSDFQQEYRSLGRQVVFFETGAFSKGSMQVAPGSAFGVETGFVAGDRRHRLVQLYLPDGGAEKLVLIREFRLGSDAPERPALTSEQLLGPWQGEAATVSADWPEPVLDSCTVSFTPADAAGLLLLADGGYCRRPLRVSHRQAFSVEAGWLAAPDRLERLIRSYDDSGAWQGSRHECLKRC
jgi:hypothetical protein